MHIEIQHTKHREMTLKYMNRIFCKATQDQSWRSARGKQASEEFTLG